MTNRCLAGSAVIALVAVFAAGPALAQSADSDSSSSSDATAVDADIVVTAQRREERLIDVPISIVAMGSEELGKRKITNIDQLAAAVPGIAIASNGETRQIQMRGLGNVIGSSSSVGLYLDEASVTGGPARQLDLQIHDLARVEVLRGPQGTLYGEGSLGGTIRFITNDPELDRFGFDAEVEARITKGGAPGGQVRSVLNVPLVKDRLALRIAGSFIHDGGWIDQPAADRNDYNGQDLVNVRAKLLWQPSEQLKLNAMVVVHHNDGSFHAGEDQDGNFTQVYGLTATPYLKDRYQIYNLSASYDFGGASFLSTTTYINYDQNLNNYARQVLLTPPDTPRSPFFAQITTASKSFTQEARLTSSGSGPFQWTVGGIYQGLRVATPEWKFAFLISPPPGTPFPGLTVVAPFDTQLSKSWAAFGDANYEIAKRLTLGVGLRYSEDHRSSGFAPSEQHATFDTLNPRIYARYALGEDANIYASVAKGFRSGGFNTPGQPTYEPEKVWTYELGAKLSTMDRRLGLEVAIFQSEYKGYQIQGVQLLPGTVTMLGFIIGNAGAARIRGIEGSLTWKPSDHWTLSFKGDYLNHKFTQIDVVSSSPHVVGDRLDLVPNYGFTASIERAFELGERSGYLRLEYNQKGKITYKNLSVGPFYQSRSDVINLLNAAFNLKWNDNLSFNVFAQNILNERGFLDPYQIDLNGSRARPLTAGAGFSISF